MDFFNTSKELKGTKWLKWPGVVNLAPNKEEFAHRCMQQDQAVKEAWEGWDPTEHKCDLTRGYKFHDIDIELVDS